jgi:type IV pilus assembly protein PilY1
LITGDILAEKKFGSVADDQTGMLYSVVSTTAVIDLNFDGAADVIYVGDMGGNLWKWAIHSAGEDRSNDGSGLRTQPNWRFRKFFAAGSATIGGVTYYKNIMSPPAAAYENGKLYIAFGTGERRNLTFGGDVGDTTENNRYYVMIDSDPYELVSPALATITESDLTDFTASASAQTFVNKGYYITLVDGEKAVTSPVIFSGDVIAATFIPTVSLDPCTTRGEGTLYVFDLQDGSGQFDDGGGGAQRWMELGAGLPTDPKVSVGPGPDDTKIIIEKSGSDIVIPDGKEPDLNGATLYWREND